MSQDAREARPPDWMLRLLSPLLRRLLTSRAGHLLPALAVLEFRGRRTGRPYRVVTGWYRQDDQEFAVTPSPWRHNFDGGAPLTVTSRGRKRSGHARSEPDPSVVAPVLRRLMQAGTSPRALAMSLPPGRELTEADVIATRKALIRFDG